MNMGENKLNVVETGLRVAQGLTVAQRVAICFAAGVLGEVGVVLFSYVLYGLGISAALGVKAPLPLKPPEIYRPLFWGRLYVYGLLYFLAPVLALFLFFLPMSGAGYFGLKNGPMFTLYLLLVNLPFGIAMAWVARAIIGMKP